MNNTALQILNKYWGYDSFRPGQDEIIENVINGYDTLALLPTGGGKSICFQIPGIVRGGLTLVISPLIALMNDQVENLKKVGVKAAYVNASLSPRMVDITLDNAAHGAYQFLYVSPERLQTKIFKDRLEKMNISLIAIDEAHCISEWGYDFRPSYLKIKELREKYPVVPMIALTATATPEVALDIIEKLNFKDYKRFQNSFQRPNLSYITIETEHKEDRIIEYAKRLKGSGIIYTDTRKNTSILTQTLHDNGISAHFYNGGLSSKERAIKQADWVENKVKIMVATNAFGMGIDKPDVRFVLHHHVPDSPEAYFQEAGRGGRDLQESRAILFFNQKDIDKLQERVENSFPDKKIIQNVYHALGNYFQLAYESGEGEQFPFDPKDFCQQNSFDYIPTVAALKILELNELITFSEGVFQPAQILFKANKMELYQHQIKYKNHDAIIQLLLRSYPGIFDHYVTLDLPKINQKLKIKKAHQILSEIHDLQLVDYTPPNDLPIITFTQSRVNIQNFTLHPEAYENRKKRAFVKSKTMQEFLKNENCRSVFLLNYFGESDGQACGKCNVCLSITEKTLEINAIHILEKKILEYLTKNQFISLSDLLHKVQPYSERQVKITLDWLLDNKKITIKDNIIHLSHTT